MRNIIQSKKYKSFTGKKVKIHDKEKIKSVSNEWISALAQEVTFSGRSIEHTRILSKEERIEKRMTKKRHREERKVRSRINVHNQISKARDLKKENDDLKTKSQQNNLQNLSGNVSSVVIRVTQEIEQQALTGQMSKISKPYISREKKIYGKAIAKQQLSDDNVQPRINDYGGLGLARPSIFIDLRDLSFVPKVELKFAEHVSGFFGKQRTKTMKKQLDGDMLWRRVLQEKKDGKSKIIGEDMNNLEL